MSNLDFTPLHVHSTYSILDGINKLDQLVSRCKELGMSACALTDHGNLHGAIEFYKECKKGGIKPIIGVECYITKDEDNIEEKTRDNNHMILLAQNTEGLKNLIWLISNANLNNFYYKPRISIKNLASRSTGLITTSACVGGWVAQQGLFDPEKKIFLDPENRALKTAKELQDIFGNRFFLELQDQDMWEQTAFNNWLLELAKREKIPLTISTDAHYLRKEDHSTHKLIMAQQLKKTLADYESGSDMKYGGGFYIKSPQEMLDSAIKLNAEEAYWNTIEIAKMCNLEIELGKYKMPSFDITKTDEYEEFKQTKEGFECKAKNPVLS